MNIRVLLVDDHAVVRQGYRTLLENAPDIEVIAEAASGEQACRYFADQGPDVVVMDLSLPGIGGLEAIRRIMLRDNQALVLVFSMHDDNAFVEKALEAGARGYITKNSAPETLVGAVREVANGKLFIDPQLTHNLSVKKSMEGRDAVSALTTREFEIFFLLAQGKSPQQAASELALSYKTVANYTTQIKSKLNVRNNTELVHLAIRNGIIKPVSEQME